MNTHMICIFDQPGEDPEWQDPPSLLKMRRWLPRFIFHRRQLPNDPVWPRDAPRILYRLLINGSDQALAWVLRHNLADTILPALDTNCLRMPRHLHALWLHALRPRPTEDGEALKTWLHSSAPVVGTGDRRALTYLKVGLFDYAYEGPYGPPSHIRARPEARAFSAKVLEAARSYQRRAAAITDLVLRTAQCDAQDPVLQELSYALPTMFYPALGAPPCRRLPLRSD